MAYSTDNPPALRTQRVGASGQGGAVFHLASADPILTVRGANYISNASELGMEVGDELIHFDTNLSLTTHNYVSAISAAGAATVVVCP